LIDPVHGLFCLFLCSVRHFIIFDKMSNSSAADEGRVSPAFSKCADLKAFETLQRLLNDRTGILNFTDFFPTMQNMLLLHLRT
jgi:hypothetical protein